MPLNPHQLDSFHRDGYLVLPAFLPPEKTQAARQSAIDLLFQGDDQPLRWVAELGQANSQVGRLRPLNVAQKRKVMTHPFLEVFCHEPTYQIASQLLAEPRLRLNLDDVLYSFRYHDDKEVPQRVHLDSAVPDDFTGYPRTVICFHYLTDVAPDGGAICLLPAGHHRVRQLKLQNPTMNHSWNDRPDWHDHCVPIPAPAGSIIFFHQLMPHRISYNRRPQARIALLCNFSKLTAPSGGYAVNSNLDPKFVEALNPLYRKLLGIEPWS